MSVPSIASKRSQLCSISGLRRWHLYYSSLIGETTLSRLCYLSGHIRLWFTSFSASRMEELTSAWFLTSSLNFLQVHSQDMLPFVSHTFDRKLLSRPPLTRSSKHITWRRLVILVLHWQTMSNLTNHGHSLNPRRLSTQYLT